MREFKVRDFNLKSLTLKFFKIRDFKVRDFEVSDFRFWTRRYASCPNPKIPHFAIGFFGNPSVTV